MSDRVVLPTGVTLAALLLAAPDGLARPQAALTASNAMPADEFGTSVATSGSRAVVGAWRVELGFGSDQGAAYVFVRSGGTFTEEALLSAPDPATFDHDHFGWDVAISGDTVVVGAPSDTHAGLVEAGAVYVFARNGATWPFQAKLTASDEAHSDFLGRTVAISGDTIAVGKSTDDHGTLFDAGSVYVYERDGSSWSETAKILPADPGLSAAFGGDVALAGDTLLVGCPQHDGGGDGAGAAYVFVRGDQGWVQQAMLVAGDGDEYDQFGGAVSLSGDTAVVGAVFAAGLGAHDPGAAYVFVRDGTSWSLQARLEAADPATWDRFGCDVAVWGDLAVVGAVTSDTTLGGVDAGLAHVFVRRGTTWHARPRLQPSAPSPGDLFGHAVALGRAGAIVGAPFDDHPGGIDAGAAFVFPLPQLTWTLPTGPAPPPASLRER